MAYEDHGLCTSSNLQDKSNHLSVVNWLSIVTSGRIGLLFFYYSKDAKMVNLQNGQNTMDNFYLTE